MSQIFHHGDPMSDFIVIIIVSQTLDSLSLHWTGKLRIHIKNINVYRTNQKNLESVAKIRHHSLNNIIYSLDFNEKMDAFGPFLNLLI